MADLDEQFYIPTPNSEQTTYFLKRMDDKIFILDNNLKIVVNGNISTGKKNNIIKNEVKNKELIAEYDLNFFAGGLLTIYADCSAYITQYGSGIPIICSYKGIIQSLNKNN